MFEQARRRPSALAMTVLGLIAAAAGVVGWLMVTGPEMGPTVSVALPRLDVPLPPAAPPALSQPAQSQPAQSQSVQASDPQPVPAPSQPPMQAPVTQAPVTQAPVTQAPVTQAPVAQAPVTQSETPQPAATPSAPPAPIQDAPAPSAAMQSAPPPAPAPTARPATPDPSGDRTALAVIPPRRVTAPPAGAPQPGEKLAPAPDPALIEPGPDGPLPIIGRDGREPWVVYARPFDLADRRPKIAIIVNGLGLSSAATEAAIQRLPGSITLSFAPFADDLEDWIRLARAAGHEVLLNLPMEPLNYPSNDPGPRTLLTSLPAAQNIDRLQWALSRVSGYVGVTNFMGSRFTAVPDAMRPVLEEIKRRGLMFVDSRSSARSVAADIARDLRVPFAVNARFIDNEASRAMIDARLAEVEQIAKREGFALAMGFPYPVTLERIAAWSATAAERGIVLVPATAIAKLARGNS